MFSGPLIFFYCTAMALPEPRGAHGPKGPKGPPHGAHGGAQGAHGAHGPWDPGGVNHAGL